MQLSLFYKLESLLCCTWSLNWRLVCPLAWSTAVWAEALGFTVKSCWGGLCAPGLAFTPAGAENMDNLGVWAAGHPDQPG